LSAPHARPAAPTTAPTSTTGLCPSSPAQPAPWRRILPHAFDDLEGSPSHAPRLTQQHADISRQVRRGNDPQVAENGHSQAMQNSSSRSLHVHRQSGSALKTLKDSVLTTCILGLAALQQNHFVQRTRRLIFAANNSGGCRRLSGKGRTNACIHHPPLPGLEALRRRHAGAFVSQRPRTGRYRG